MCRPCLYTAHVYRDDVTLNLGRYYIYGKSPSSILIYCIFRARAYEVWRKPIRTTLLSLKQNVLEKLCQKQNWRKVYCLQLCFRAHLSPEKGWGCTGRRWIGILFTPSYTYYARSERLCSHPLQGCKSYLKTKYLTDQAYGSKSLKRMQVYQIYNKN
jgi:hypothetical protein